MQSAQIIQFKPKVVNGSSKSSPELVGRMENSFKRLFSEPGAPSESHPHRKLPAVGPFNAVIEYTAEGEPVFPFTKSIDQLRGNRPFSSNAVEMRCDALALVIYVSGVIQLSTPGKKGGCHVRVVAYTECDKTPFATATAASAEGLMDLLHVSLVEGYNNLSTRFNLAGFRKDWLVLASSNEELIPSIPLMKA